MKRKKDDKKKKESIFPLLVKSIEEAKAISKGKLAPGNAFSKKPKAKKKNT